MKISLSQKYANILDDIPAFEGAISRPLPGVFWMNPLRANERVLLEWFSAHGISCHPLGWYLNAWRVDSSVKLGNTVPYAAGWYCVQEEVALTAVHALDPQPGEKILDLCASPGGKTAQISFAVGPTGLVIANEKSWQRLTPLAAKVDNMGLTNVVVTHANGMRVTFEPASFDRVLADVPCSGEGTVRKLEGGVRVMGERLERVLPETQAVILRRALRLVKAGGVVVYSTCTMNPSENEAVLSTALGDLGVVEKCEFPGFRSSPGLLAWEGKTFREDVANSHRFYPHYNDTGGFFVARIRRTNIPFRSEKKPRENCVHDYRELNSAEREAVLLWLEKRYGVLGTAFDNLRMFQRAKIIRIASQNMQFPNENVNLVGVGVFEKTTQGFVLTAPGAQLVSLLAQKAVLNLESPEMLASYLRGETCSLNGNETLKGIVAVRSGPFGLGKGVSLNGDLESHFPKAFRFHLNR